jgi:hypothetical protein
MAARKKAAKKPAGSGAASPGPVKPPWGEILTGNFGAKLYRRRGKAGAPIVRVRAAKTKGVKATTGKTKAGTSKTKAGTSKTKAKASKTKARTARPKAGRAADTETRVRTSNFGAKKRARRK